MVQESNHERSSPYSNAGKRNTRTVSGRPDQCLIYSDKSIHQTCLQKKRKVQNTFRKQETQL